MLFSSTISAYSRRKYNTIIDSSENCRTIRFLFILTHNPRLKKSPVHYVLHHDENTDTELLA